MQIKQIKFSNYRNLTNLEVNFSPDVSFIIGENGIGKSNILNALSKIFVYNKFSDSDFAEKDKEIQIDVSLSLSSEEIGAFDEYTDPSNPNLINLIIKQGIDDITLKVFHVETEEEISPKLLKNVFYIYYDSLRNPKTELSFEKEKGGGSFLNFLIKYYLGKHEEADEAYVDKTKLSQVLAFVNEKINQIQTVRRSNVSVNMDSSNIIFLNSIFQLYDGKKIELKKSGYGIQFSLLVIFSLFERLIDITAKAQKQGRPLKEVNCVMAFDEPEIHLHPFAQRALVKDLLNIAAGKDEGFNKVIKELLVIETFTAQLLIVSHSDRIIVGGYENIVRIYSQEREIKAISGHTIKTINAGQLKKYEKHLQKQFPYFCEAMFAKKVLFVEGECELGALNVFAKTMGIDIDNFGISIINAYGGESVNPLIKIFSFFKIECLGLKDRDVYDKNKRDGKSTAEDDQLIKEGKLVLTHELNFEFEIVKAFGNMNDLYSYLKKWDASYVEPKQKENVNKFISKFNLTVSPISNDLKWEDCDEKYKKIFLLVALSNIKSIAAGAILAEGLTIDNIPQIYKEILGGVV